MVTTPSAPPSQLEVPPLEPWATFHPRFRARWKQGQHCLFNGPTGSGKTVACRTLARDRQFVIVFGTKPKDDEMDAYLREGYVRVEEWPPPRKALRPNDDGSIRIVLWPKIKKREDLRRFRPVFLRCIDELFVDGNWTLVVDEGLWCCDRNGLDLGSPLEQISYGGRSSGITLMALIQRPAGVPRNIWSNVSHAFLWHMGITSDTREMASLGTKDPKAVARAIQSLRGFQFLYLPTRAGGDWAVSQVDISQP
jgi:hypothetical protein